MCGRLPSTPARAGLGNEPANPGIYEGHRAKLAHVMSFMPRGSCQGLRAACDSIDSTCHVLGGSRDGSLMHGGILAFLAFNALLLYSTSVPWGL